MKKSKKQLIEEFISKPYEVGEKVYVRGLGSQNKNSFTNATKILSISNDKTKVTYERYGIQTASIDDIKKYTDNIGVNPFNKKRWDSDYKSYNVTLETILMKSGYTFSRKNGILSKENIDLGDGLLARSLNFNPYVFDKNDKKFYYQRDKVWNLEDKQKLIDSIFKFRDIGKICIRLNSFDATRKIAKEYGNTNAFICDLIDGKQRVSTLIEYFDNKFCDKNGNYFKDLSDSSQRRVLGSSVILIEVCENSSDKDTINVFLNINYTGVNMNTTHLEYIRNIEM